MNATSRLVAGRYRIVDQLGGGGTSLVYRAAVEGGGPDVALKELRPQYAADASLRRRFLREAELARGLDHPGIVRLLDAGQEGDIPFLVMELVQAETLRELLDRERRLPIERAWPIFVALARALDHAHARGVIHRDVKPENIFVADGGAKLADFGNARVVSLASVTGASLTWGTPEYVAPEMFMRGRADPRSDLYALGVVLYEMLAGRLPWSRAETLTRLGGNGAVALRIAPTGAAAEADRALADLLAFSPADRPASGQEILARTSEPEVRAVAATTRCAACGAARPDDVPRCFACGAEALSVSHDPTGRWRLVLQRLDDDVVATERLLRLLDPLAQPVHRPLHFLTGNHGLYSEDEFKKGIALPAVLFSQLDESTARGLESLFRARGLAARAVEGTKTVREIDGPKRIPLFWYLYLGGGVTASAFFYRRPLVTAAFALMALALPALAAFRRWKRVLSGRGILRLREQVAAVPIADALLAGAVDAAARVRAPEVRALFGDVAAELYRLTRRAGDLGARRGASSSEAALVARTMAAAPALTDRLRAIATRLDALDEALEGPSEGELMQGLARLERAADVPGADRDAITAARRDLDATLERRHATEHERARLSAALCRLLGRLRHVFRRVSALETLEEQEARVVEASSAELEAFLTSGEEDRRRALPAGDSA